MPMFLFSVGKKNMNLIRKLLIIISEILQGPQRRVLKTLKEIFFNRDFTIGPKFSDTKGRLVYDRYLHLFGKTATRTRKIKSLNLRKHTNNL